MNINEFEKELKSDIDRFITNWKNEHKNNPKDWPLEMNDGDWFDQFMCFIQDRESEL